MLIRLLTNTIIGYILGLLFSGYGFFWLVDVEFPWTAGIIGAVISLLLTIAVSKEELIDIFILFASVTVFGFIGCLTMLTFSLKSVYPIGPICTLLGIIFGTILFLRRR